MNDKIEKLSQELEALKKELSKEQEASLKNTSIAELTDSQKAEVVKRAREQDIIDAKLAEYAELKEKAAKYDELENAKILNSEAEKIHEKQEKETEQLLSKLGE